MHSWEIPQFPTKGKKLHLCTFGKKSMPLLFQRIGLIITHEYIIGADKIWRNSGVGYILGRANHILKKDIYVHTTPPCIEKSQTLSVGLTKIVQFQYISP